MQWKTDIKATDGIPVGASPHPILKAGDIELDQACARLKRGLREVRAGPTELRLLAFLMQNHGRVLSRDELLKSAWPEDAAIEKRTVDVYIRRLRRALNRGKDIDPIRTVRNAGYLFELT
jgi:two-component system phosphate regulon response regulator PhoB